MLTIHHLGVSQSERIVWLCEELGVPYELRRYQRTGGAPPEYKALHPAGTAPIITDGEFCLAESAAIVEYIIHTHGGGRMVVAPGAPNYAQYLYWFHYANGSFMPHVLLEFMGRMGGLEQHPLAGRMMRRVEVAYRMIETRLAVTPYFAGDELTAADVMMLFPLTTMRHFTPRDFSSSPNTLAYLARIGARPAYQRAMQNGDPGMSLMLQ